MALSPIEEHLRNREELSAVRVIRGWPLTVEGVLRNADAAIVHLNVVGVPDEAIDELRHAGLLPG